MKRTLLIFLPLLLAAFTMDAATNFTATNWIAAVPVPGVQFIESLKGSVCILRVQSDDSRVAGRLQITMDLAQQGDGSSLLSGPAYLEVGVWDAAGTTFTLTGGVWDLYTRGLVESDGSLHYRIVGEGIGGAIAGMQLGASVQRAAGGLFDVSIPSFLSGTVEPSPTAVATMVDDFNDGNVTGWTIWDSNGSGRLFETNGQMTVRGYWPGVLTRSIYDTWAKGFKMVASRTLRDGQTLERRTDLIRMSDTTTALNNAMAEYNVRRGYTLMYARNYVALNKFSSGFAVLCCDNIDLPSSNVVLSLAVTRVQSNLLVTARVQEMGEHGRVLFERGVWDTPLADPTLSSNQIYAATGMLNSKWKPDVAGLPWFTFDYLDLELYQQNNGTLPEALAVFDNLQLGQYDIPAISIQPAVRLSWPENGMNFVVQGAPSPQGPWQPMRDLVPLGFQQLNLPQDSTSRYFRLRQSP